MTKWILAVGVAALAIASPALADRSGQSGGQGKGGDKGQSAKSDRGGGQAAKADRGGGNARITDTNREGRAMGGRSDRNFADQADNHKQQRSMHGRGSDDRVKHSAGDDRIALSGRHDERRGAMKVRDHGNDRVILGDRFDRRFAGNASARGLIDGCPPGLFAKNNGCLPPGQAKKLIGTRLSNLYQRSLLPPSFRNWYPDSDEYYYREANGYAYRVNRDRGLIDGLFPLFNNDGNYFAVGQRYPMDYDFYNVPTQYQSYYADNDDYYYRYGDGGIYQVNRSNGLIEGIAALLAGDFGVGQRMPLGYDAYNVPYAYRDRYYDTADNMYRYNDGYIYQVDARTQLIQAVISALI